MTDKHYPGRQQNLVLPEYFAKALKNKDRIIQDQANRIKMLDSEVQRLHTTNKALGTQLALLSYKLRVAPIRTLKIVENDRRCRTESPEETNKTHSILEVKCQQLHKTEMNNRDEVCSAEKEKLKQNSCRRPLSSSQIQNSRNHRENSCDVWSNNVETSEVLCYFATPDSSDQKRHEMEERYGSYLVAHRAASKIQHTFRKYSLNRNFEKLRLEAGSSTRRSQRFGKLVAVNGHKMEGNCVHTEDQMEKKETLNPESEGLSASDYDDVFNDNNRCFISSRCSNNIKMPLYLDVKRSRKHRHGPVKAVHSTLEKESEKVLKAAGNDNRVGSSLLLSPVAAHVDLPSFKFENVLEDGETDVDFARGCNDASHMRETLWSSSSSSSIVSTPFELIGGTKELDILGDCTLIYKMNDINSDIKRAGVDSSSCDQENSAKNKDIFDVDGNCLGSSRTVQKMNDDAKTNKNLHSSGCNESKGRSVHTCLHSAGHPDVLPSCARMTHFNSDCSDPSPIWKRKNCSDVNCVATATTHNLIKLSNEMNIDMIEERDVTRNTPSDGPYSSASSDSASLSSNEIKSLTNILNGESPTNEYELYTSHVHSQLSDKQKKRFYRIGLNLFNRKPEKGISFLIDHRFLDNTPRAVARFLLTRKGLSKQMIGEYLGNILQPFNMDVLEWFVSEMDLAGLPVDKALRKFQCHFRMPGEAQKIEKLMEAFATCYIKCNTEIVRKFLHPDTIFLIAYAIIMLNTDLHNNSIKPDRKMKLEDFVRNLRGIDGGKDVDLDLLTEIYKRISAYPLKPANDHVIQVLKVEKMILGKKPQLAAPHRRLICYCRLYEIKDPNKREKPNLHQREVFLFNDILLITKLNNKKKDALLYNFRESFTLFGMTMVLFELPYYKHGVQLVSSMNGQVLMTLCASNEADRKKFVEDLNEAIMEVSEMEALRVKEELAKKKVPHRSCSSIVLRSRESGTVDGCTENRLSVPEGAPLIKTTLGGSLGDFIDGRHRASSGPLYSGLPSMNSGSTGSFQDKTTKNRESSKFNIFTRRSRHSSSSSKHPSSSQVDP